MAKNQKSDQEPPKDPLEQRVDEMMDIHVDETLAVSPPETSVKPVVKVVVNHADDVAEATAPPVPTTKKKKPVPIVVTHFQEPEPDPGAETSPKKDEDEPSIAELVEATNSELAEGLTKDGEEITEPLVDAPEQVASDVASAEGQEEDSEPLVTTAPPVTGEPVGTIDEDTQQDVSPVDDDEIVPETPEPMPPRKDPVIISEFAAADDTPPIREVFNDAQTAQAVDDIIAKESDELLAAEDARLGKETGFAPSVAAPGRRSHFSWLKTRATRKVAFVSLVAIVAAAGLVPATRYTALNAAGVRSAASLSVVDESTQQPLKNVAITLAGKKATTDSDGKVRFDGLRLGTAQLSVQKRAFAPVNRTITIGWGSNPLGSFSISPVGTQYTLAVQDYVSGKPLGKVQAEAAEANAQSDDKGVVKLTLDKSVTADTMDVALALDGYRTEKVTLNLDNHQPVAVSLVPANKDVFISKRNGTYDVYAKYADGKDEQKILAGTGNEQESMVLSPSPDGAVAALVSTRDDIRNEDGFLESTLTLINLKDVTSKTVVHSEQIKIVDWSGTRLVYVQVAAGASAASPNRQRLMSYDYKTGNNHQLVATNYFNDVLLAGGLIYYAPSSTYQAPGVAINLFSINPDGSNKQTVLVGETWNAFRTAYDKIVLSVTGQQWYEFSPKTTPKKLAGPPAAILSRAFIDSPDGTRSLWVDSRDGKGVLLSYDVATKKDTVLDTRSGLMLPVRWLNNTTLVFRVHTDQETADYALSTLGGSPKKITDVTNTGSVDKWYYY